MMSIEDRLRRALFNRASSMNVTRLPWNHIEPGLTIRAAQRRNERGVRWIVIGALAVITVAAVVLVAVVL